MKAKEIIFLSIVFLFLAGGIVFLFSRQESSSEVKKIYAQGMINVLFVLDDNGKAVSTNLLSYYTENRRGALIDIPAYTGLILKTLNRTDGIAAIYEEKGLDAYCTEVEKFLGIEIPFELKINVEDFAYLVDMLGGISVFIPNSVELKTEDTRYLLPSGLVTLDGEKLLQYVRYEDFEEDPIDIALRKQKAVLAFLRSCNENKKVFFADASFKKAQKKFTGNLKPNEVKNLLTQISQMDVDRVVPQRVAGTVKMTADGKKLLFPVNDGQQIKNVVKQTLSSLSSEEGTVLERVYAVEILNATDKTGLAKKTSEIFQSFGYDVTNVANADEDRDKTVVIDRIGNRAVAEVIANIISCKNIDSPNANSDEFTGTGSAVDFTIILGSDFNGQHVINK